MLSESVWTAKLGVFEKIATHSCQRNKCRFVPTELSKYIDEINEYVRLE